MCVYTSETSKHFLGMLLENNPKDGQLLRNMGAKKSAEEDKATWYTVPFQIRDASEK